MKYQVPQFINVEDKIFGPFTAKQFLYIGGAAAVGFMMWSLLPKLLALLIGGPIVGLFLAFAFYKFDGWQPFIQTFENAIKYFGSDKIYIWKKVPKTPAEMAKIEETQAAAAVIPKLSDSKLKDLSWSLDIKEHVED